MPVLGYSLKSISFDKKDVSEGVKKVDINVLPKVVNVEEKKYEMFGDGMHLLVEFEFTVNYSPDIATMKLEGDLVYSTPDNKKVVKEWSKSQKLPEDIDLEIKNFLFRRCLTLGINMSSDMQLPPPVMFPFMSPKEK